MRVMKPAAREILSQGMFCLSIACTTLGMAGTARAAEPPAGVGSSSALSQPDPIKALVKLCEPSDTAPPPGKEVDHCYARLLHEIMQAQGPTLGMLALYQLAGASPRFADSCHVTAHHLADAMYDGVNNIAEAMALCQEGCAYACQHAVLMNYLRGLSKGTSPDLARVCPQDPQGANLFRQRQCAHGVGHGLTYYFQDVAAAVMVCKGFARASERSFCRKGVFMEHASTIARTQAPQSDPDRYFILCTTLESQERDDCYFYAINLVYWATGGSIPAVFAQCETLPVVNKSSCYRGIGHALAAPYLEQEDELIRLCQTGQAAYVAHCHIGFAGNFASFLGIDRGFGFCAKLPEEERTACAKQVGVVVQLRWAGEDRVASECGKAGAPGYVRACLDAMLDDGAPSSLTP